MKTSGTLYAGLALLIFLALLASVSENLCIYRAVGDKARSVAMGGDIVVSKTFFPCSTNLNYQVRNGKLYLSIRVTRVGFLFGGVLGRQEISWTDQSLKRLILDHPELKSYMPARNSVNMGIVWISELESGTESDLKGPLPKSP